VFGCGGDGGDGVSYSFDDVKMMMMWMTLDYCDVSNASIARLVLRHKKSITKEHFIHDNHRHEMIDGDGPIVDESDGLVQEILNHFVSAVYDR
jgi:hypothetical protein